MDKRFPLADQIEMLDAALKGRVVTPGHAEYDALRAVTLGNFDRRPAAVIRVANAADVAAVLNFARGSALEVAVRSGGHSTCGHSGSEGGLVIDLRDLNDIEIDTAAEAAWAGAGLTAGEVTAAVEKHGLIVGFGDSATVGIGGLTLGGGIGYLVRKYGLTIDSLLAAEVVTAAGDILVADEGNHPELFWALRGGGGNFGVVTRLKYRLYPLPAFTGGPLVLPATAETIAGFVAAAQAAPEALSTIAMVMPAPPMPFLPPEVHGQTVLLGMMAYAGEPEAAARALAPFRALATPLADLVGPASYSSMYLPEDPNEKPAVSVRTGFMERIGRDEAAAMLATLGRCEAPMRVAQIRVLGGAMARVPATATAFAHRQRPIMMAYLALYGDAAEQARHDGWATEGMAALPLGEDGAYVNFLGVAEERLGAAYPNPTLERLRQIKGQYDPENMFRLNHNILPAA
ncbi:MAG TPA: FAD-binding oxidoreductase [Devosiaceae bacterium]|jgi:FAD/FMN-containing dehydrogenase|nr:FAD-binding oxidoreductase [Devosiaceae bacterium]